MIKKIFFLCLVSFFSFNSYAWTLVYETDIDGNVTSGSLQTLRTALSGGASLRVLVTKPGSHVFHIDCNNIYKKDDVTQTVVCSGSMQLALNTTSGDQFGDTLGYPFSLNSLTNTLGQYSEVWFQVGPNKVVNKILTKLPMQWYVN